MKAFKITVVLCALAAPAFAEAVPVWEKVKTVDGIEISKGRVPGDPVLAFRGEGDVEASIETVATVIFDCSRAPEWVDSLKESRIQRWVGSSEYVEYDLIGMPPLIADRDFVSIVALESDPGNHTVAFRYRNAADPALPEQSRRVRGELKSTVFILRAVSPTRTHVIGEVHVDPKGALPKWLVNWAQADWPETTFKGLRRQSAKLGAAADPLFRSAFAPWISLGKSN